MKLGSFYLGRGSQLLPNIYQGISVATQIWNLEIRKIPRNGNLSFNFQQNMRNIGEETRYRPFCFKVVKSASKLLLLEVGSQQSWHKRYSTEMVSQESIYIPSIYLDSQSTEKGRGGESTFYNNSKSDLVAITLTSFNEKSNHFVTKGRLSNCNFGKLWNYLKVRSTCRVILIL